MFAHFAKKITFYIKVNALKIVQKELYHITGFV